MHASQSYASLHSILPLLVLCNQEMHTHDRRSYIHNQVTSLTFEWKRTCVTSFGTVSCPVYSNSIRLLFFLLVDRGILLQLMYIFLFCLLLKKAQVGW